MIDLIEKKKSGGEFTSGEISFLIRDYVQGVIPDYQMSALLMAIWFQGMSETETILLTMAMSESGEQIDLADIPGIKVDKHSTGGVADTTTLIAAPLVAACGGVVAKMSGRGLGHTGGTLDKLESIPGFSVDLTRTDFARIVNTCGLSIIGQSVDIVPADKKIYALRDVTGTIDNLSLIAASIMSKKLASGADVFVLDVKTGSGAFMQSAQASTDLARLMVKIGKQAGKHTVALVTDMSQPLGMAVGNSLEVKEAIEILRGERQGDLKMVSLALAREMLLVSGVSSAGNQASASLEASIREGTALNRLANMIEAQGGNPAVVENTNLLPKSKKIVPVLAEESGYVASMDTASIGVCAALLGAGRQKKEDTIDHSVGIWMKCRIGSRIERGTPLADFHLNSDNNFEISAHQFVEAIKITNHDVQAPKLIYEKFS